MCKYMSVYVCLYMYMCPFLFLQLIYHFNCFHLQMDVNFCGHLTLLVLFLIYFYLFFFLLLGIKI